jgi:twinkle protein
MCPSSDAYHIYDDGHGHCFSCGGTRTKNNMDETIIPIRKEVNNPFVISNATMEYLPFRGLTKDTVSKYRIATKIDSEGKPHSVGFHYPSGAIKSRLVEEKKFNVTGENTSAPSLFGMDLFPPASAKAITITEGELDAPSVFQMLGSNGPAVSVRGSSSARKDCAENFDYLNSFEKVVLAFDNDDAGRKAAREVAQLFDFNKVFQVTFDKLKDANEYLLAGKEKEFRNAWYTARRYLPEGVVSSLQEFEAIIDADEGKESVAGPFPTLDIKSGGIRSGEFILVKAPEGVGKTEFFRAFEYHFLTTTDANIAAIHLEESKSRQLKGLAGYELKKPAHLPEFGVSTEEIKEAIATIVKGEGDRERLHIYSHFGSDDPHILIDVIRFLVTVCECKYVFLDHITMVVSGHEATEDERRTLDFLSTTFAQMCHDLDFTMFCISHVNDDGKTRGSRNISKVSHFTIELSRDIDNPDEFERNKMFVNVSKSRFTGRTGPAGVLRFDPDTYTLSEINPNDLPVE